MLVQQAITYLSDKEGLITSTYPHNKTRQRKYVGYLNKAREGLGKLPTDAPLELVVSTLRADRTERELKKSNFYKLIIAPLEIQLSETVQRVKSEEHQRKRQETQRAQEELIRATQAAEAENAKKRIAEIELEKINRETAERLLKEAQETANRLELERRKAEAEAAARSTLGNTTVPNNTPQVNTPSEDCDRFLNELNTLRPRLNIKVQAKLDQLLRDVGKLIAEKDQEIKAQILEETSDLLTERTSAKEYQDFAKKVQGKPSPLLKAIGAIMIALAAAVVAYAFIVPAAGLSLQMAGGAASALVGLGAYSMFSGRQKGISRDMDDLANTHVAELGR
jgi:hypothetical protein